MALTVEKSSHAALPGEAWRFEIGSAEAAAGGTIPTLSRAKAVTSSDLLDPQQIGRLQDVATEANACSIQNNGSRQFGVVVAEVLGESPDISRQAMGRYRRIVRRLIAYGWLIKDRRPVKGADRRTNNPLLILSGRKD